jgi:hypothetical protein
VVQWLALLTAVGGLGWLGVLAVLGYLQLPVPEVPRVEGWPIPTLMIAGGALLGILLAITAKFITVGVAHTRATAARKRLKAAVSQVAGKHVIEPVEAEIGRMKAFSEALKTARK